MQPSLCLIFHRMPFIFIILSFSVQIILFLCKQQKFKCQPGHLMVKFLENMFDSAGISKPVRP